MLMRTIVVFAVLIVASGVITKAQRTQPVPARQPFYTFPMKIANWYGRAEAPLSEKELQVLGADDYLMRSYFAPGRAAGLYIGYWSSQKRGDAVHSPLNCLPGAGWQPTSHGHLRLTVPLPSGAQSEIQVNRYVIQKGLDRQMVLYWYQSHGRVIASEYWGKYYLVADAVRLGRSDTAIVRVVVPIPGNDAAAEKQAETAAVEFVQEMFPTLNEYIPA
jgi:EpsI family protein